MIIMMLMTAQRVNLSLQQDSTANLEIFLTGLFTIVIIAVGGTQIIAGTLGRWITDRFKHIGGKGTTGCKQICQSKGGNSKT